MEPSVNLREGVVVVALTNINREAVTLLPILAAVALTAASCAAVSLIIVVASTPAKPIVLLNAIAAVTLLIVGILVGDSVVGTEVGKLVGFGVAGSIV